MRREIKFLSCPVPKPIKKPLKMNYFFFKFLAIECSLPYVPEVLQVLFHLMTV